MKCNLCDDGWIDCPICDGTCLLDEDLICEECEGSGDIHCSLCDGTGEVL